MTPSNTHLCTIALFGEAERGHFRSAYYFKELEELEACLGEPPPESRGLFYAVQAILHRCGLIFLRVREEGFSLEDYLIGFKLLEEQKSIQDIAAICLPGVGNRDIIEASTSICNRHKSLILTNEKDLYDYLTQ